jgi:hypothetical protein
MRRFSPRANTDRHQALDPRPHDTNREAGQVPAVVLAPYYEGLRAPTQELRITNPSITFQVPLADGHCLFVDDAGSCPVKKQLPMVAGIASSVATLSVESS